MTAANRRFNQENYFAVPCPDGSGVKLIPRGKVALRVADTIPGRRFSFTDAAMPLSLRDLPPRRRGRDQAGAAMNNLGHGIPTPSDFLPGKSRDRRPVRDNGDQGDLHIHLHRGEYRGSGAQDENGGDNPVPLDPDLLALARQAGSQAIVQEIYKEQAKRDARREQNGDGCYGPSYRGKDASRQYIPRPKLRQGDQDPDLDPEEWGPDEEDDATVPGEGEQQRVLATLDPLPSGLTYVLRPVDQGVALLIAPDTDNPPTTHDRTWTHRIGYGDGAKDPVLVSMNRINRGYSVRDAATRTSTLLVHRPLPGERLVLEGPTPITGSWSLLLISPVPGEDMMETPKGAEDDLNWSEDDSDTDPRSSAASPRKPQERELPQPTFRDRGGRLNTVAMLQAQNRANRAFWSAKG